ncbi:MAG: hypothetical protein HFE78_04745 [Clostridiales bacterium]|nr:hypothetical protein [Clostridiales bacterium]
MINVSDKLETVIAELDLFDTEDIDASLKNMDSIMFISLLIKIEEAFHINFADGLVNFEAFKSFETIVEIIQQTIEQNCDDVNGNV